MNCLYQTTSKYTLKEYSKFTWALISKKRMIISIIILELSVFFLGYTMENVLFYIFGAIYPLLMLWMQNRQIKKVWLSNKVIQDTEMVFEFYDTYFVEKTANGETILEYAKLDRIIDTKSNMYLMISKNQGYLLIKENFPEGLEMFLKGIRLD